jgi:hypothetical protein
MKYQR